MWVDYSSVMCSSQSRFCRVVVTRGLVGVVALAVALSVGGCNRALFRAQDERTQYDRYDTSRGNYEPMFLEDEFGRRRPNLRGRLEPRG